MPEESNSKAAPTSRRVPFDPVIPLFREWAVLKAQVTDETSRLNKIRDKVAAAIEQRGYVDHKGSQYLDLPFPIAAGDTEYVRIKRERRVSVTADEEVAERLLKSKSAALYARAFPPVPTLDVDELYVLLQEGHLTEEELDSVFVQRETFAFRGLTS